MSKFFIDRPIFAWVLAVIMMIAGGLALVSLPIEQYPGIAPPTISIEAMYPGADSGTVENSVTQIIEQKLTGLDEMRYFNSSSSDGSMTIMITFEPSVDPDIAQVQVQNKVQEALPQLPKEVQTQGVRVTKSNDLFLLVVGFYSEKGQIGQEILGDLVASKVKDVVGRLDGVGSIKVFGQARAMRIWLNPDQLLSYNMTPLDVNQAIAVQNKDISAGQLGGMPAVSGQQINASIVAQSRLKTVEDFEKIILRVNQDGSQVRLKDVARVELGSEDYGRIIRYNGLPAAGMGISLAPGANALDTVDKVKTAISNLKPSFPAGVKIAYPYDTTPFVKLSIKNVMRTLIEAIVLVFVVMYVFLQNFRVTLIPAITIPVVLLGTFSILSLFGMTINVLTMFAMVLAIGLLVDDAIVVVENVERVMRETGLPPREATHRSMSQIGGALVGITLVLCVVFVPMAYLWGAIGVIYRQFALTIIVSISLSMLVALILTPALCATILTPLSEHQTLTQRGFFGVFNRCFSWFQTLYLDLTRAVIGGRVVAFLIYGVLVVLLGLILMRLPISFLPDEDQGTMFLMVNTPASATTERTLESVKKMEHYLLDQEKENVKHLFTVTGFSFAGVAQNAALGFVRLKDWSERTRPDQSVFTLARRTMMRLAQIKDALIFAFYPPPITELGHASGFDCQIIDRAGLGHGALMGARNQLLGMAAQNKKLLGVRPNGLSDVPRYRLQVDHEKVGSMGLNLSDVNGTLQTAWGSFYVNDFMDQNRVKRVLVQGDAPYRMNTKDLDRWYVRNQKQEMVPFSAFSSGEWTSGSPKRERFNAIPSINIQGGSYPGVSSGEAMGIVQHLAQKLPQGIDLEWFGLSYEEVMSAAQAPLLYTLSFLVIFLCLAALYESWALPLSVMMSIPFGVLGTVLATWVMRMNNDVYFQVALLTTIGLSARNAILIVEFSKSRFEAGDTLLDAALSAAKIRFRPIIMTALTFILGVTPLALASGAGSASQNAIGVGVIGGMIGGATIALCFVPLFYIVVQGRSKSAHLPAKNEAS